MPRATAEPVFYYVTWDWYKGSEPPWYDVEKLPGTKLLRENYAAIKDEVLKFDAEHGAEIRANFTPYAYETRNQSPMPIRLVTLSWNPLYWDLPEFSIEAKLP